MNIFNQIIFCMLVFLQFGDSIRCTLFIVATRFRAVKVTNVNNLLKANDMILDRTINSDSNSNHFTVYSEKASYHASFRHYKKSRVSLCLYFRSFFRITRLHVYNILQF